MPEQLTRHPEVTLQVLKSAGARCGEGVTPQILTACPAERFCQLPGGEICVYGLGEAHRMTQIQATDWQALAPAPPPPDTPPWAWTGAGLLGGLVLGLLLSRRRASAAPQRRP